MSSTTASELQDDISIFEIPSPESLRARTPAPTHSPPAHDRYSTSDGRALYGDTDDDYFARYKPVKRCTSGRSSISSFPASVVHHTAFTDNEDLAIGAPSRTQSYDRTSKTPSQGYLSAFRHPNSVRALQLESEYADSDNQSLRNQIRPRKSPRVSHFSPKSPSSVHSSPTKRSSRPGTPLQHNQSSNKLKKAFPLVLLHCTLLAPSVAVRGPSVPNEILEAVLPEEYRKRWRTLQDKVTQNTEVRQRGVLIPHPREDYDLLEESLLETLELERPRIRKGHYLGKEGAGSDSGFESSSQNGTDEGSGAEDTIEKDQGDRCPDCGSAVSCTVEQERRWEVKVFAANGLMRGGAWAAAWEQMEKVDVEVGIWMPEDVRVEVEERLKALQAMEEAEKLVEEQLEANKKSTRTRSDTARVRHDARMKEIYGDVSKSSQEEIDGLVDKGPVETAPPPTDKLASEPHLIPTSPFKAAPSGSIVEDEPILEHRHSPNYPPQEDFLSFLRRHIHLIWNDQKNLAIVLLSILVLTFSVQNANANRPSALSAPAGTTAPAPPFSIVSANSDVPSQPPLFSHVTTTILVTPTPALSFKVAIEEALATSAEPEEEISSSTESYHPTASSSDSADPVAPTELPHQPAVHLDIEDVEDAPIVHEPVIPDSDLYPANDQSLEAAPMLTETANDKHISFVLPSDLQWEHTPLDMGEPETADEDFTPASQPDEYEDTAEESILIDSSTTAQDDDLALSSLTNDEADISKEFQIFLTEAEEEAVPHFNGDHEDQLEEVIVGTEQTQFDLEHEDVNNV